MLRPTSTRDASTCLRCHLRLFRSRHYSSEQSPLPRIRYQSSPSDEATTDRPPLGLRNNHGRIRGKRGGQRRVESSEPLTINSLGQSSEIIVLRDLHDSNQPPKPVPQPEQLPGEKRPALTARDIENLSGRRAPCAQPTEVFDSIDSLRPDDGVHVLSKVDFDAKFTALAKAYNIGQLRAYLRHKAVSFPKKTQKSRLSRPRPDAEIDRVQVTEISTNHGELQHLNRTPWHPGTTDITKRLSMTTFESAWPFQMSRKMSNKEYVVESIMRRVWALGVEEEQVNIGEIEFLLTPMQFGLLLTKNSNALRPLLESHQFYKNSYFRLYQADHAIRIIGPHAEAEAFASVLAEAFVPARTADIGLDTFRTLLRQYAPDSSLKDIFNPPQLNEIMALTRTYVRYDDELNRVQIASFVDAAINDAHRLLVALLPLPPRTNATVLYDDVDGQECRRETALTTRNLPFRTKHQNLGRWVAPSTVTTKPSDVTTDNPLPPDGEDKPFGTEPNYKTFDGVASSVPMDRKRPIVQQALEAMEASKTIHQDSSERKSYWPAKPKLGMWRTRIGHVLREVQDDVYPKVSGTSLAVNESRLNVVLAPQYPGLVSLLSKAKPIKPQRIVSLNGRTELVAHLIPSPLEAAGVLATTAFPPIELHFTIEDTTFRRPDALINKERQKLLTTKLDGGKQVTFYNMRAIVDEDVVELNLPGQPVDLHFQRKHTLICRDAGQDTHVRSFVNAVHKSMKTDASLRAPPALQVQIPRWAARLQPIESVPAEMQGAAKAIHHQVQGMGKEVSVKYLFAGFEHREKRDMAMDDSLPEHKLRIETIEAGVTGGRRVELSLLAKKQAIPEGSRDRFVKQDLKALVDASVDLVNLLKGAPLAFDKTVDSSDPRVRAAEHHRMRVEAEARAKAVRQRSNTFDSNANRVLFDRQVGKNKETEKRVVDAGEHPEPNKVAQQEQGLELDSVQDSPAEESSVEFKAPEMESRVVDASAGRSEQDIADVEGVVKPSAPEQTTPETQNLEVNSVEAPAQEQRTNATATVEQTLEPEAEEKLSETEPPKGDEKPAEEEPLSVRLRRRLMNRA